MVRRVPQVGGRAHRLLVTLTELYIRSGKPVSSAEVSKALEVWGETVPPSTVRLDLRTLEEEGYLTKPHPSGGRIPTARAYRVYVESLGETKSFHPLSKEIREACQALAGEVGRLLDYAGEVLASESGYLGFVTSPSLSGAKIRRFRFHALEEDLLLLRLELTSGGDYHRLARFPVPVRNFRLDALAELLTERLMGRRLDEVKETELEALIRIAAGVDRNYDLFVHPLRDLIIDARLGESPRTVIHGAAGLLKASGENPETVARAVELLDDRSRIERAIESVDRPEELSVVIGDDGASASDTMLEGFAIIIGSYHIHAQAKGKMGILGPMRMHYATHLALVRSMADLVSRILIARQIVPYPG